MHTSQMFVITTLITQRRQCKTVGDGNSDCILTFIKMSLSVQPSWKDIGSEGDFKRQQARFRLTDGHLCCEDECTAGRFHVILSLACPWSHRVAIVRNLKGLEDAISMDVVHPYMGSDGWHFEPGKYSNNFNDFTHLSQFYKQTDSDYDGRITVPVLYDKHDNRIVCNESSDIIRVLNSDFQHLAKYKDIDLYPEQHMTTINDTCSWLYDKFNNAVYRAGFATSQNAYESAANDVFSSLERMNKILSHHKYIAGTDMMTAADIYAYPTLFRFDSVYAVLYKCCKKRIVDYPFVWSYLRRLYHVPAFKNCCDIQQCMTHYYKSQTNVNPHGIVPMAPTIDWSL